MLRRGLLTAILLLAFTSLGWAQELLPAGEMAEAPPRLAVADKLIDFDYSGDVRGGFQALGRAFGLRALFDDELPSRPLQVSLRKVRFEVAADILGQLTNSFWAPVDERTFLVAANTSAKRQQFEPQVSKTLLLAGATTEQFNEITQALKKLLEIRRVTPDTRTRTLTIRDTPARVEIAERLAKSLVEATPEVQVDITVLELDRRRSREIGLIPPEQAQILNLAQGLSPTQLQNILAPLIAALQGLSATELQNLLTGGAQALNIPPFVLFGGGRTLFAANLPNAEANLRLLESAVRQSRWLTLRSRAGQTATMNIGERVPVIFVSFRSIFSSQQQQQLINQGVFQNPFPAVQYQDIGVNVSLTPWVHAGREVTLKMKFQIMLPTGQSLNDVPVFSEREVEHTIRLKEGETAVLAGLLAESRSRRREGTPGLDGLVSNRSRETEETELILLVTPRLLRLSPLDGPQPAPLYIGTEAFLRSR